MGGIEAGMEGATEGRVGGLREGGRYRGRGEGSREGGTCYPASHSHTCMYSVFLLLTFIPLLSEAYLQLSSFSSTCSLLSLQITMSSANIMVRGASSLISSVILSIIIANKQGLKADP